MFSLETIQKDAIVYQTSSMLLERSIFLAFTTRSSGNLALHVDDDPDVVVNNRLLMAKAFGINEKLLTCAQQVHGNKVYFVDKKDAGRGYADFNSAIKETDALITDKPNILLSMFFADCLPVVLVGLKPKIVAVVHAGYKGLINGVIGNAQSAMFNSIKPKDLLAFLGPSIGPCCYKVDDERLAKFKQKFSQLEFANNNLDLKAIATFQLKQLGVKEENIFSSKYCTNCNPDLFFSYRQNKITGRQAAVAMINS